MLALGVAAGLFILGGLVHKLLYLAVCLRGTGVLLDKLNDLLALLIGDKGALNTGGLAAADRGEQHIAHADKLFRSDNIQNNTAFKRG